jgi:hypothetical protein
MGWKIASSRGTTHIQHRKLKSALGNTSTCNTPEITASSHARRERRVLTSDGRIGVPVTGVVVSTSGSRKLMR